MRYIGIGDSTVKTTPFLLQAKARTLNVRDIYMGGEEKAFDLFKRLRWSETDGAPVCPRCGCTDHWFIAKRRRFKCKGCCHQYSPTSGTIFANRKMMYVDLLAAIALVVNGAKGVSALQLARDVGCHPKTAWVFAHKLREAMAAETGDHMLSGEVEIDGAYFGGHIRPANLKEDRVDRRFLEHQTGKRRVVIVARQRKGRTRSFVVRQESEGVEIANRVVHKNARVHADEASHWDGLHARFFVHRINHSEAYSLNGVCTNQAESYFSRLRRMVSGQHHHVSARHLHAYAAHAAWMEDHRRDDNGALARRALGVALAHPVSRNWKGRWQKTAA